MSRKSITGASRAAIVASSTSVLVIGAMSLTAQAALATPKSGMYDQIETITSPMLNIKSTTHLEFKGTKFRLVGADAQDFAQFVNIVDGQSFYHFVPLAKEATRVELPKQFLSALDVLGKNTQDALQGAQKTGETTVGEIDCDIYTKSSPDGLKATLYLDKDPQFPYLIKSVLTRADTEVSDTTVLENIKLNVPVPETQFTLPTGTKIDQAPPPSAQNGTGAAPSSSAAPAPSGSAPTSGGQ